MAQSSLRSFILSVLPSTLLPSDDHLDNALKLAIDGIPGVSLPKHDPHGISKKASLYLHTFQHEKLL